MANDNLIQTDGAFLPEERRVIAEIAAAMIPASDDFDVPAADDPEILTAIVERLARAPDRLRPAITDLAAATEDDRQAKLAELRAASAPMLNLIASAVAQAYYQDPRVIVSLGMEPRPPYPDGYEIDQGDWTLLDPVKRRAKFYRPVL